MSVKKGHIIDEYCDYKGGELVEHSGVVYSCILNQTDLKANANKFYIMQLVHSGSQWYHFIRYGRIGEPGKASSKGFTSQQAAINAFDKQFKAKTGNTWNTANFVKKDGKYFLSQISYEKELADVPEVVPKSIPDSTLPEDVQKVLRMLSDINMMQNTLVQLDIDTKKMPLGKLKAEQIDAASELLDKIGVNLETATSDDLIDWSSQYYTLIPNSCGRRKPPLIDNREMVAKYKGILDDLSNIVITKKIIDTGEQTDKNPLDAIYEDLHTAMSPLARDSEMYQVLEKFVANTHGPTHGSKLEILQAFEIQQEGKHERFLTKNEKVGNRMLLFHGTPQSCILSILKKDFYLDPSKLGVQIAGKMFGYGVYFADIATKSFNYTRAQCTDDIGCFLVCEVALGKQSEKIDCDMNITKNKLDAAGYDSTWARGKWEPSTRQFVDGDLQVPNGILHENTFRTSLRYNEFIVYDIDQIFIKYLIVVKNNGNYSGF